MVWVVQERPGLDILSGRKWGEMRVLLPWKQQVLLDASGTVDMVRRKLRGFSSRDYILCAGDPAAIGIACAIAAKENNGRISVLKWDRYDRAYYPVEITMWGNHND